MKIAVGFKGLALPSTNFEAREEDTKLEVNLECDDQFVLAEIDKERGRVAKSKRKSKSSLALKNLPMHSTLKEK